MQLDTSFMVARLPDKATSDLSVKAFCCPDET